MPSEVSVCLLTQARSQTFSGWELEAWGSNPEDFLTGLDGPMGLTIESLAESTKQQEQGKIYGKW